MNQRTAISLAAALTALVLAAVGLTAWLNRPAEPAPSGAPAEVAASDPTAGALDPTVEALMREREAAYQAALAEANARLEAANAEVARANAQVAQAAEGQQQLHEQLAQAQAPVVVQAPAAQAAPAAPSFAVTPEQAQATALAVAPGAAVSAAPELVSFEGAPAYEVRLDRGLVYVDAQSGAVLANGAAQPPAPAAQGPAISGEQAAQLAIAYRGGGEVDEVERDEEDGLQVYEVKFRDGSKVYVDAASGQVVYARIQQGGGEDEHDDEHEDD